MIRPYRPAPGTRAHAAHERARRVTTHRCAAPGAGATIVLIITLLALTLPFWLYLLHIVTGG